MELPIFVVDAFADRPFGGNPAGVVPLDDPLDEVLMLAIAGEMKHAETAFFYPEGDSFRLRWFTPETEVELCGHATLASAHILYEQGYLAQDVLAKFDTRSGRLTASSQGGAIQLDFPALTYEDSPNELRSFVDQALQTTSKCVMRSKFDLLAEVESEEVIHLLDPDMNLLNKIDARGLIVTAKSDRSDRDFVSRFFAPRVGVPEDPVTGSAHCLLAPYWAPILLKTKMVGYQASARGGYVTVELLADRVLLTGKSQTVLEGKLYV